MSRKFASRAEIEGRTVRVPIAEAIKRRARVPCGGPVVGSFEDGCVQILDGDSHDMVLASSGRKKTRAFLIPTLESLALAGRSLVVNDMKGEILAVSAALLEELGYDVLVLDFRSPAASPKRYNPLSLAWEHFASGDKDGAASVIRDFADLVYSKVEETTNDAFWPTNAKEFFSGICLGLLECGCPLEAFTLETVFSTMSKSNEELRGVFGKLRGTIAEINASPTLNTAPDTRRCILSMAKGPISVFCSQGGLMDMLSASDFSARDISSGKTALFIVSPDETGAMAPIVTTVISQLMSELIRLATETGGCLDRRVDFILDEFGNLKPIPGFGHVVSACRSRGLRLHLGLQSISQLEDVYGSAGKETIVANVYNIVFMGSRQRAALGELSELLGTAVAPSGREVPVLGISDLLQLEKRQTESEAICLIEDLRPFTATLPDYEYLAELPPVPRRTTPKRPRRSRPTFDITNPDCEIKGVALASKPTSLDELEALLRAYKEKLDARGAPMD